MDRLKWSQLTPVLFQLMRDHDILNGCGSRWFRAITPQFMFEASCWKHDFYYWVGGSESDRKRADDLFLVYMLKDANRAPFYLRWWHRGWARLYHFAVRVFAKRYFHYSEKYRTMDDLEAELGLKNIDP